jgi:membrane protease subunit HflC
MSARMNLLLIVVVLLGAVINMSVFTVDERELAIKFRFGEIIKFDFPPGLHLKWPLVNNVVKYPDRILNYDNPTERFLTDEKKNLLVDYFVDWRIRDAGQYYRATGGDERIAEERLTAIIKDGIKAEFSSRSVKEVVSAERYELMEDMLVRASSVASELGIEVVDVRVKRIDLSDEVSDSVFNRMRQERGRVASQLRAEGVEESEKIRSEAERQRTVTLAEAYREAESVRGTGDGLAAEIYAEAYAKNPEFYAFYRSMQAYRRSLGRDQDVLVLTPDSDFFRFLQQQFGELE